MKRKRAGEDYLRVIYELDDGEGVKSIDVAKKLKVTKASVSEMLRKLSKEKLIKISPYSKIFLTKKGKILAEKSFEKYFTIKKFLKKIFEYENEKAAEESHELEHAFSEESVEKIKKLMEGKTLKEPSEIIRPKPSYVG